MTNDTTLPRSPAKKKSDYIRISECHTGTPDHSNLHSFPRYGTHRAYTSFSDPRSSLNHTTHQKSQSVSIAPPYLDLETPEVRNRRNKNILVPNCEPGSIEYRKVDFRKTEALRFCRTERTERHINSSFAE